MIKRVAAFMILLLGTYTGWAQQIINGYGKVTEIDGKTLYISTIDETYDAFVAGENIIVMQMQDDVIGGNTNNNANFGNIANASSGGLYEKATIESIVSGGTSSQTIWKEDFEDLSDGDTQDNGETAWSRGCNRGTDCYASDNNGPQWNRVQRALEVSNDYTINGNLSFIGMNLHNGSDNDDVGIWTSESIDISEFTDVAVALELAEENFENANGGGGPWGGNQDPTDYIEVYYIIDGGQETEMNYTADPEGNFGSATATVSGLSGSTLQIVVYMMCEEDGDKYAILDDIEVTGNTTAPSGIVLEDALANSYNIGDHASVQIITFPNFSDYITTTDLTALPWDGEIGGVFAIDVDGTLLLENSISVDGLGFRGGGVSNNYVAACESNRYISSSAVYGGKGEGVYKSTNNNYTYARGHIANGGGGGSHHNSGGGAGGNFTEGGEGGPGYNESESGCTPGSGGIGGADLSGSISSDRFYMGGGGGGGQQNDSGGTDGGNGGGIIIVRAGDLVTGGGCASDINITANGEAVGNTDADGGGGAGAGGSILLQVENYNLNCTLNVTASGGDGSDITDVATHGGGGGGGKGVIIFSGSIPAVNLNTDNEEGEGGDNNGRGSSNAEDGKEDPSDPDADDDGIFGEDPSSTLPVDLSEWSGVCVDQVVYLSWTTLSEQNNDYFSVYRSLDGEEWLQIAQVSGNGTTNEQHDYSYDDNVLQDGITYYQLSQTDYDGQTEMFDAIAINTALSASNVLLYPNPSEGDFSVILSEDISDKDVHVRLYNQQGQTTTVDYIIESGKINFSSDQIPVGSYVLQLSINGVTRNIRLMIK